MQPDDAASFEVHAKPVDLLALSACQGAPADWVLEFAGRKQILSEEIRIEEVTDCFVG